MKLDKRTESRVQKLVRKLMNVSPETGTADERINALFYAIDTEELFLTKGESETLTQHREPVLELLRSRIEAQILKEGEFEGDY